MAQHVGYGENNVEYKEGPFVVVNPLGNGHRIEVELKGHYCPVLPDLSIYDLMEMNGWRGKTIDAKPAEDMCDLLNSMVREGRIVLKGRMWVAEGSYGGCGIICG